MVQLLLEVWWVLLTALEITGRTVRLLCCRMMIGVGDPNQNCLTCRELQYFVLPSDQDREKRRSGAATIARIRNSIELILPA